MSGTVNTPFDLSVRIDAKVATIVRSSNIRHIPAIDHLRGVAALMIIFYHGFQLLGHCIRFGGAAFSQTEWVTVKNPLFALVTEGHSAVSLFMVLSGFIFTVGASDREVVFSGFMANRLWRILPMSAFMLMVGASAHFGGADLLAMLQATFLGHDLGALQAAGTFAGVMWTIAIEFQFYLVFPFLIAFYQRRGARYLLSVLVLFMLFRWLAASESSSPRDLAYWTILGHMDQFLFGMLAAIVHVRRPSWHRAFAWLFPLSVVAVIGWLTIFNHRGGWPTGGELPILWPTLDAATYSFLLLTYVSFSKWVPRIVALPLEGIGAVSFSVYLVHFPVIHLLIRRGWVLGNAATWERSAMLSTTLLLAPAVLALSALTYFVIEKPFLSLRRVYLRPVAIAIRGAAPGQAAASNTV